MFNKIIIDNLRILEEYEKLNNNGFKANAYNKVIDSIELSDVTIKSEEDLKNIKGIGSGILKKIVEIIKTGKLEFVETILHDEKYILSKKLIDIYGIGPAKLKELMGVITNFDDLYLEKNKNLLNAKQKIGFAYYNDLKTRIPYDEGKQHYAIIKLAIKKIIPKNEKVDFEMVGSYRRKNADLGDIDILIKNTTAFDLKTFIKELQDQKYIVETLASGKNKFMGISKLSSESPGRRIDILVAEPNYYPFALLYFTGSYSFNITMRKVALKKGLSLSEYGFKDTKTNELIDTSDIIKTEEDIFKYLDMPFVKPNKR